MAHQTNNLFSLVNFMFSREDVSFLGVPFASENVNVLATDNFHSRTYANIQQFSFHK